MAAVRIQCWAYFLSGYDFETHYVKLNCNMADSFSRLSIKQNINCKISETYFSAVSEQPQFMIGDIKRESR